MSLALGNLLKSVADQGFPVGGCQPRRGAANSRGSYVS